MNTHLCKLSVVPEGRTPSDPKDPNSIYSRTSVLAGDRGQPSHFKFKLQFFKQSFHLFMSLLLSCSLNLQTSFFGLNIPNPLRRVFSFTYGLFFTRRRTVHTQTKQLFTSTFISNNNLRLCLLYY